MTVVVKIHELAAEALDAWMTRHSQPPTGSREMAKLLKAELFAELARTEGKPEKSKWIDAGDLSHFRWQFSADTWVRFVIHDQPARWFRPASRKVIITSISDSADG